MTENQLLGVFKQFFPERDKRVKRWFAEDGALLNLESHNQVSVLDLLIEDIHFKRKFSSLEDVGYKSVAVNLSDLAACGADPSYVMLGLAVNEGISEDEIRLFYKGFTECLAKWDVSFAGGDFSKAANICVAVSAVGEVKSSKEFWTRSGAASGDYIYVTGVPGLSALGLDILKGNYTAYKGAVEKHLKPEPPILQSRYIKKKSIKICSCTDVSDGLSTELNHISSESGVRLVIDTALIPHPDVECGIDYAMNGGEDYELLFTSPETLDTKKFEKETGS
ncbi:MAG: thiamine-phosphate kinase, partial [Spirochaetes bacterium]|nr:thiamine-phosphate kinase [Spirochaetota bacterium]